jgi:hypothetical protein
MKFNQLFNPSLYLLTWIVPNTAGVHHAYHNPALTISGRAAVAQLLKLMEDWSGVLVYGKDTAHRARI